MNIAKVNGIPIENIHSIQLSNKRYVLASSGRMMGKSNIQNISRDHQDNEWLWQHCQGAQKEKENSFKLCETCNERFRCWTASRPYSIFSDDMQVQMITLDEVSEAFKLSSQLCEEMTKKFVDEELNVRDI